MALFSTPKALLASCLMFAALAPSLAAADTLAEVKAKGKMVVAVDPTFAPFEYTDASGKIVGYTPALMEAVGKKLGVSIEYQKMAFNGIIPGLLAGSFDAEGSTLNVTAERAKRVLYTVPFAKTVNLVMTRADDSRIPLPATIASLSGLTGVAKAGTAAEKILKDFNGELKTLGLKPLKVMSLDTVEQTIAALNAKRADFVFDDITVLGGAMQHHAGKFRAAGELGASQWMAWATRPDDKALNAAISDVILGLQASGELAALQKKHLGVVVPVPASNFVPAQ
jgi:polar amino acid transport system substrate-binding protein